MHFDRTMLYVDEKRTVVPIIVTLTLLYIALKLNILHLVMSFKH